MIANCVLNDNIVPVERACWGFFEMVFFPSSEAFTHAGVIAEPHCAALEAPVAEPDDFDLWGDVLVEGHGETYSFTGTPFGF
jgi:hypothetical protein